MKKTKVKASKTSKSTRSKSKQRSAVALYASDHDFIIIAGGGLVVLMLTVFLFLQ